jgi:branched-chain amino acid transport system substrate-binding protein
VKRIGVVLCDDSAAETPSRAAQHLVDDVGVPAILGFRTGHELVDLSGSLLVRRGVVSVASLTTSPLITRLPQPPDLPRMVWRTTSSFDGAAVAAAVVVHDVVEPKAPPGRMRVTLARLDAPGHVSFGQTFMNRLVFNGKSAIANGADYQELALSTEPERNLAASADAIVRQSPTVVVVLASPDVGVPLVERIEAKWPAATTPPTYLVALDLLGPFSDFLGRSAAHRHRIYGLTSTSSSSANAHFVIRYNIARDAGVSRDLNPGNTYDAFYVLAFAVAALGAEPVTGPALARSFARLTGPGLTIEVGPTQVFEALTQLARGGRIDLEGTHTGLDFDLSSGEVQTDFALQCAAIDASGHLTGAIVDSGLVFEAKSQKTSGVVRCP